MDRRSFLSWVGVGWIASCLPIAIAACSRQTETPPASKPLSPPRSDGFQAVTTVADLEKSGHVLVKDFPGGAILVARDPGNRSIAVVNPTCTHQGCVVNWKVDEKRFACPCHDAEFAADGKVLEGPATSPLKTFTAKIEGDTVLVKA